MKPSGEKVTLTYRDKTIELPVYKGTQGPNVVDIGQLYRQTGLFTYDPGYKSTASCASKITFIDGDKGILRHYGYPIDQLAENGDYIETCYLLLNGELPNREQYEYFNRHIMDQSMLHEQMVKFYQGFRRDAHPMAILVSVFGALSAFYHSKMDLDDQDFIDRATYRMLAKMPTIAAHAYRYAHGRPFVYPRADMSYAGNFLRMCFFSPMREYNEDPLLTRAMDKIFILHADHEQNASTSTVRLASSSRANPYACVAAGVVSLWGPAHGGANEAALKMLEEIGRVENIPKFIARAKDKNDHFRLMGFGHRVYKNYDPRAKVMRRTAHEVLNHLGIEDPLLEVAMELEKVALNDEYFIERRLYPNIDFYSGITLRAMGFPTTMFTALFAIARTVGWVSQWREGLKDPDQSIGRPRQVYTGPTRRDYVPMDQRG